ncbi:hypothetical protein [Dysgonomonas termitidis]|uniref:Uncharacterized protein n=1 Tax=Dysgonomonas termitidis TaxID=1516126 RepID=A0ABV9KSA9_9BACT
MQYLKYKELVDKKSKLQEEIKEAIICTLKANNGRFKYISPDIDDEDAGFEDGYPVISTLWGKHGTYNVAITEVYLVEQEHGLPEIYVDGIEQELETEQKGFMVYPPQFSDIIHFLMTSTYNRIHDYATRLALHGLVGKYNLLPDAFIYEDGTILSRYDSENYSLVQKYVSEIERLMKDSSEAIEGGDRDNVHSRIMKMADDLTILSMLEENMMVEVNNCFYFREKFQDKFNDINDEIEADLNGFFNLKY